MYTWPRLCGLVAQLSDYRPHRDFSLASRTLVLIAQGGPMLERLVQPTPLLLIFGIALLVLGPKKLPELGKGIGDGIRGFKSAMAAKEEEPGATNNSGANQTGPETKRG